jgi:phosphatidate cytidylyltransferase
MTSNLAKRIGFAVVAIPVALLVVWLGGWTLAALVSVIAVLGVRELYDLAARQGNLPLRPNGFILAALFPLIVYAALTIPDVGMFLDNWWPYMVAIVTMFWLLDTMVVRSPQKRPLAAVSITIFGICYAVILPSFLLGIRHGEWGTMSWGGAALVFFPLVVTWVCDSAAMFGGGLIGGPKLAPSISPGKTKSGAVCGVVGGMLIAPVFVYLVFPAVEITMPLNHALLMAMVLSVVGQVGDLGESLLKREAGVKDSSNLIPGHGGVLDRFDSLYFVLPVAAAWYHALGLT